MYDVVDLTYSANTAIITPLKEGSVTLTVSHPKSAFDQQIKIKIQQYDTFGFSGDSKKITEGSSSFISMQIPASNVETYVSYRSANEKICKISGTKAVCELTGTGNGTTTVYADLVAKKTDSVLSTAEMLVYVEKAAETLTYITGDGGISSTFSMTKGTNKILSAELVGQDVKITDQPNLTWVSSNPGIVKINGTDTTGKATGASVYVEAVESGECTITVSHPKSNTDMVYRIIVPGVEDATVSLNKSFVTLEKGKTTEIKATIEGGTNKDYKSLVWSINKVNGAEIASVMGSGQTVTVYALQSGTCNLRCALANGEYAECTVKVEASKTLSFDRQVLSVEPAHTKTFVYKVSPADATLEWVYSGAIDGTDYINIVYDPEAREIDGEIGKGTVTIEGIKEGNVNLNAVSSYGNKAKIQVRCEWNYEFKMESAIIMDMNKKTEYHLEYTVNPADAVFEFGDEALKYLETYTENSVTKIKKVETASGHGYFVITPKSEITGKTLNIKAINPTSAARGQDIGNQKVSVNCHYNTLDIITKIESDGKFSRIEKSQNTGNNILYMGDGETAKMIFSFAQPKTTATIEKVEFNWDNQADKNYGENRPGSNMVNAITSDGNGNYIAILQKVCSDRITEGYHVSAAMRPVYKNGYTTVDILDWKESIKWYFCGYKEFDTRHYGSLALYSEKYSDTGAYRGNSLSLSDVQTKDYNKKFVLFWWGGQNAKTNNEWTSKTHESPYTGKYFSMKSDSSLKGFYSKSEFYSIAYWFCPGVQGRSSNDNSNGDRYYKIDRYEPSFSQNTRYHLNIQPHILTEHVTAQAGYSNKTTPQNAGSVGTLTVTYSHLGEKPTFQIPVMLEIRECEKNLITTR